MKTPYHYLFWVASFVFISTLSFGQNSGTGQVTILKARGVDTTYQQNPIINSVYGNENKIVRPSEKGAPSRGPVLCNCRFDNRTDLFVDVYVDSNYFGTMAPWGNWSTSVLGGRTKLYAIARFDDGVIRKWGPVTQECLNSEFLLLTYDETFDWNLKEVAKSENNNESKSKK